MTSNCSRTAMCILKKAPMLGRYRVSGDTEIARKQRAAEEKKQEKSADKRGQKAESTNIIS
jgi:hypothetical protein